MRERSNWGREIQLGDWKIQLGWHGQKRLKTFLCSNIDNLDSIAVNKCLNDDNRMSKYIKSQNEIDCKKHDVSSMYSLSSDMIEMSSLIMLSIFKYFMQIMYY